MTARAKGWTGADPSQPPTPARGINPNHLSESSHRSRQGRRRAVTHGSGPARPGPRSRLSAARLASGPRPGRRGPSHVAVVQSSDRHPVDRPRLEARPARIRFRPADFGIAAAPLPRRSSPPPLHSPAAPPALAGRAPRGPRLGPGAGIRRRRSRPGRQTKPTANPKPRTAIRKSPSPKHPS